MADDVEKVCFEASHRFMVVKRKKGSISVWKLTGEEASHYWDLNFNSVSNIVLKNIENDPDNFFGILLSSEYSSEEDAENNITYTYTV